MPSPSAGYTRFPCVTPGWDNTPRREHGASSCGIDARARTSVAPSDRRHCPATGGPPLRERVERVGRGRPPRAVQRWGRGYLEAHRRGSPVRRTSEVAREDRARTRLSPRRRTADTSSRPPRVRRRPRVHALHQRGGGVGARGRAPPCAPWSRPAPVRLPRGAAAPLLAQRADGTRRVGRTPWTPWASTSRWSIRRSSPRARCSWLCTLGRPRCTSPGDPAPYPRARLPAVGPTPAELARRARRVARAPFERVLARWDRRARPRRRRRWW